MSKVKVTTEKKWGFRRILQESLICFALNSHRRCVWSLAWPSLKIKVNFGNLCAVYVWENVFAVVCCKSRSSEAAKTCL